MPVWFYIFLGIIVNCLWATAFLVPYYLSDINPIVITIGRYLVYGFISILFVLCNVKKWRHLTIDQWKHAFLLAFVGNVGYYLCLTVGISYGGITLTTLIISILPITMIVVGNFVDKEFSFNILLMPVIMVFIGIVMLNLSHIGDVEYGHDSRYWAVGFFFAVASLGLWTWYGVSNASFLKKNPSISSNVWTVAIGVACFVQSILGLVIFSFVTDVVYLQTDNIALSTTRLIVGCLFLGVVVSWLVNVGWNQVSRHIPMAVVGPLIVFETLSSLTYGYIVDQKFPTMGEFTAIVLIISGVILGIRVTTKKPANEVPVLRSSEA